MAAAVTDLRPDIVLMDLSMPGLDGIEAIRAVARALGDVAAGRQRPGLAARAPNGVGLSVYTADSNAVRAL